MIPLPQSTIATNIQAAMDVIAEAKIAAREVIIATQADCQHVIVSEMPYRSGGLPAERICNHCRLIEEGSHWSGGATWSRHDFKISELGNVSGRLVLPITRDEFYKMRLPL